MIFCQGTLTPHMAGELVHGGKSQKICASIRGNAFNSQNKDRDSFSTLSFFFPLKKILQGQVLGAVAQDTT